MNRNLDRRIRVRDALVDGVLVLAIAGVLFPALGAALTGPVGVWALLVMRGLRAHRRAGRPITGTVLRDAALLRLQQRAPFRRAKKQDITRVFRRGGRDGWAGTSHVDRERLWTGRTQLRGRRHRRQ
ncbi:hypothetical protein [Saccharopolyspora griseoalba]|uniref:RDD domain-containing protein n=1 Tax=Saccharopolyspora griseoalba TaxID=1431848 RepID=A0ABW2LGK0_9PSEU